MRSLRLQLLFSHLSLVLLMVVMMIGAIFNFVHLGGSIDRILKNNLDSVVAAQDMKEALEREDSAAIFFAAGQKGQARAQYREYSPVFTDALNREAHNVTEPGEQQAVDDIIAWNAQYVANVRRMLTAAPPYTTPEATRYYFSTLKPDFMRLHDRAQDILDINERAIRRASNGAKAEARRATLTGVLASIAAFVLALFFALRMIGASLTPLRSLARQAEEIGAGHYDQRIHLRRSDEIGALADSFNHMAAKVAEAWQLEEQRLHRAERMSDAALASLYDPVIITDATGAVVHWNRAAEGLFGPEAPAIGRPVAQAVRDSRIAEAVDRAIHQDRVSAAEGEAGLVSLPPGEAQRAYRLRASPMRDDDGSLLGAVAVLEDITHLRELDRLKAEFIGVASHELRTPVTSLLLSVQLLQEGAVGALTPDQQEVVAAQREDMERLDRMMRDLLDITRLEAGVLPPRFEVVSPGVLIEGAVHSLAAQSEAKSVTLTASVPAELPRVRADAAQAIRVLVNLISNAIRHTPRGGTIRVWADKSEGAVVFHVSDTGVGIPQEYLSRIFERFVQVPGATRGGAGLGLSIAQSIVKAHGGTIWAESLPGNGSTFHFSLPVAA